MSKVVEQLSHQAGLADIHAKVVAGERLAADVARFPLHPYHAPLTATTPEAAADLARGAATGLVAAHVALVRELRGAAVELEAPPDRAASTWSLDDDP